jgi:hypothetical protein
MIKSMEKEIFPSEEIFQETYSKCLDKMPQATEAIISSYAEMSNMFDEYLEATEEWVFRYAYQCGYEAALRGKAVRHERDR